MPLPAIEVIESPHLALRPVQAGDLADLLEINGDPAVTQFLPYTTWQGLSDAAAWLERMHVLSAAGTAQQLVVVRKQDRKVIGTVLLFRFEETSARLELGYVIGRAHWRQGYAREALVAVIQHAFQKLSIRRVEAEVNPNNLASNALLRNLGFAHEGILRQRWVAKGVAYDVNVYGLLASEWWQRHGSC
jgi:RimJ/RimL family protein N-acetyltransferase